MARKLSGCESAIDSLGSIFLVLPEERRKRSLDGACSGAHIHFAVMRPILRAGELGTPAYETSIIDRFVAAGPVLPCAIQIDLMAVDRSLIPPRNLRLRY